MLFYIVRCFFWIFFRTIKRTYWYHRLSSWDYLLSLWKRLIIQKVYIYIYIYIFNLSTFIFRPDSISPIKTDQLHYFIKNKPKRVSTGDLNIGVKSKLIPPHCHVCCTTQRKSTDVHNFDAIEVLENNSLQVDSGRG